MSDLSRADLKMISDEVSSSSALPLTYAKMYMRGRSPTSSSHAYVRREKGVSRATPVTEMKGISTGKRRANNGIFQYSCSMFLTSLHRTDQHTVFVAC